MATSLVLGRLLPRPQQYWVILWWLALVVGAQVALRLTERGMRRFMPLTALLDVSAVFPDHAPSRFSMALRMGNVQKSTKAARFAIDHGLPANLDEALSVALTMVTMLGEHDRGTRGHSERVRAYSELLGIELGLDRHARERLKWGALLHDIGKLAVPAEILNKAGRPDPQEWAILQTHPGKATRILAPLEAWLGDAFHAADQHHERWDGRGYPNGLAGEQITFAARIVSVADAFTVMTTARAYKKPMSIELARRELTRGAGTQFDPAVVRAMLSLSIGRVTLTAGPAAALVNIPFLGSLVAGASAVPAAVASSAMAAGVTAMAVVAAPGVPVPAARVERPPALEWSSSLPLAESAANASRAFEGPDRIAFMEDSPDRAKSKPAVRADSTGSGAGPSATTRPSRTRHAQLEWNVGETHLAVAEEPSTAGPPGAGVVSTTGRDATASSVASGPTSSGAPSDPSTAPMTSPTPSAVLTRTSSILATTTAMPTTTLTVAPSSTIAATVTAPPSTTIAATTTAPPSTTTASSTAAPSTTATPSTTSEVPITEATTTEVPTTRAPTTAAPTTVASTTTTCPGSGRGRGNGNGNGNGNGRGKVC